MLFDGSCSATLSEQCPNDSFAFDKDCARFKSTFVSRTPAAVKRTYSTSQATLEINPEFELELRKPILSVFKLAREAF